MSKRIWDTRVSKPASPCPTTKIHWQNKATIVGSLQKEQACLLHDPVDRAASGIDCGGAAVGRGEWGDAGRTGGIVTSERCTITCRPARHITYMRCV